mmetsp:Transcript_35996/g.84368  ORF Transcript_35996/g.84368 Transcript_35996/m.84368 type:complete len:995 (+) Transcript_35996:107-3091(+)
MEATETPKQKRSPQRWRGCHVKTPYGWGICTRDEPQAGLLQVALNWRLCSRERVLCTVRRADVVAWSFCAVGECVATRYGTGVLLAFRPEDDVHHVQLSSHCTAYLKRQALLEVVPAAAGLEVETPYGPGVCRGYRSAPEPPPSEAAQGFVKVDLDWGKAVLNGKSVHCKVAKVLPCVRWLVEYSEPLRTAQLALPGEDVAEALQGLGLEQLLANFAKSGAEAIQAGLKVCEEFEAMTPSEILDSLHERLEDFAKQPHVAQAYDIGQRLFIRFMKAERFSGEWVGREDKALRCRIKDCSVEWHWGEKTVLDVRGWDVVVTMLERQLFHGHLSRTGEFTWSDGDVWIRSTGPQELPSSQGFFEEVVAGLQEALSSDAVNAEVKEAVRIIRSLLASEAKQVRSLKKRFLDHLEQFKEAHGPLIDTRVGVAVKASVEFLKPQFKALLENPESRQQIARLEARADIFFFRLVNDMKVQAKVWFILEDIHARVEAHWQKHDDPYRKMVEAWIQIAKERLHQHLLKRHARQVGRSLEGLKLQDINLLQTAAGISKPGLLQAQLEKQLMNAIEASGLEDSAEELIDRFSNLAPAGSRMSLQKTSERALAILDALEVPVPKPLRRLVEEQARGRVHHVADWSAAVLESLQDIWLEKFVVDTSAHLERLLKQVQEFQGSPVMARYLEYIEKQDMEYAWKIALQKLDAKALINSAEEAILVPEAREKFVDRLKDFSLDFLLRVLPTISIDKYSGSDNGCDWELNDINFSDIHLRKEDVVLEFGEKAQKRRELFRIVASNVTAQFRQLKVTVQQQAFPSLAAEGVADARAEKMRIIVAVGLRPTASKSDPPQLIITAAHVHMESLDLWVEESNYSMIVNTISYLFAEVLKDYACERIAKRIETDLGTVLDLLNTVLSTVAPIADKLGWQLPLPEPPRPGGKAQGRPKQLAHAGLSLPEHHAKQAQCGWTTTTATVEVQHREDGLAKFGGPLRQKPGPASSTSQAG